MDKLRKNILSCLHSNQTYAFTIKHLMHEDYWNTQKEFIDYYSKKNGVTAIYRFGNVGIPGISDLDFIVILSPKYRQPFAMQYGIAQFSPQSQFILLHPQLFIPRVFVSDFPYLHPLFELDRVFGEPTTLDSISKSSNELLWGHLIDNFIMSVPRFYWQLLFTECLDIRMALAKMNLLKYYSIMITRLQIGEFTNWIKFNEAVTELRKNALTLNQQDVYQGIVALLPDAIITATQMAFKVAERLHTDVMEKQSSQMECCRYLHVAYKTRFEPFNDPDAAIKTTIEHFRKNSDVCIGLPVVFSVYLRQCATQPNLLGNYLKNYITSNTGISHVIPHAWMRRTNILASLAQYCIDRNLAIPFFPFYGYSFSLRRSWFERNFIRLHNRLKRQYYNLFD